MSDYSYNGWTNRQTWWVNLRYKETFAAMAEEQGFADLNNMADAFQMLLNDLEFDGLEENSLAYEAVDEYLTAVDWEELAHNIIQLKQDIDS